MRNEDNHLSDERGVNETEADFVSLRGIDVVHQISHLLDDSYVNRKEAVVEKVHIIKIEEMLARSDRFRRTEIKNGSETYCIFSVYSIYQNKWFDFPMPNSENIIHKGGLPRLCLKILAKGSDDTIEAELPANDIDVLAAGKKKEILSETKRMGVDSQGVEFVDDLSNLAKHLANRDVTLNCCLMGKDFLAYTTRAWSAARSGKVEAVSEWRGIYGRDTFTYEEMELKKHRALMRLVKMVAEKKAKSFMIEPINKQQEFGIYWLVLSRKFSKKNDFPLLMERMFFLNRQLGQVGEGESDIFELLNRVHSEYPQFDFDAGELDMPDLVRWYVRKLTKQADKIFRDTYKIRTQMNFKRESGDNIPFMVSADGFEFSGIATETFLEKWNDFIIKCRERTRRHRELEKN